VPPQIARREACQKRAQAGAAAAQCRARARHVVCSEGGQRPPMPMKETHKVLLDVYKYIIL